MTYAISILIVFAMLAGWVLVQHLGRRFAARHPEFGPPREEGSGCCMGRGKEERQGPQCAACPKQLSAKDQTPIASSGEVSR